MARALIVEHARKSFPWTILVSVGLISTGLMRACVTIALIAAPYSAFAQSEASATERQFWETVKESKNPQELQAYLTRYPNGAFAELARVRLAALQAQPTVPAAAPAATPPAAQAPATPTPAATAPPPLQPIGRNSVLTSAGVITEVQNKLFDINYTVGTERGTLTAETQEAIRRWQRQTRQPITGDVTPEQLTRLRSAKPPTVWAAISYSWTGSTGVVWSKPDRRSALDEARRLCEDGANRQCSVVTVFKPNCGAVAHAPGADNKASSAHGGTGATLELAQKNALDICRQRAASPEACTLRNEACADGSHRR